MYILNCIGLFVLGAALLWAVNLIYARRRPRNDDVLRQVLLVLGWVFLLTGFLGALVSAPGALWLFIVPAGLMILVMTMLRYRRSERRALAMVVGLAAERGVPLPHAIQAFADDSNNEQGLRAMRLAQLLESGVPLPDALKQSRIHMPGEVVAAVNYGHYLGALGPALKRVVDKDEFYESHGEAIFEKFAYLLAVAFFGAIVVTFLMLKIVPTFDRMFQDFELELPALTLRIIEISRWVSVLSFLVFPLLLLLLVGGIVVYFRWLPTSIPLIGRLTFRSNVSTVLRLLSLTVQRQRSLLETVELLAARFPHGLVRSRLKTAAKGMHHGQNWCDSLLHSGLYKRVDATVLRAAERAGNLAWALNEMADSSMRRSAYRNVATLNILFPALMLAVGAIAGVFIVGLVMPLVSLILKLS